MYLAHFKQAFAFVGKFYQRAYTLGLYAVLAQRCLFAWQAPLFLF